MLSMTVAVPETTTRNAILDAMDSLMARYGFRKTTVDDVAREARISRRTIYTYFSSKEELGLASIERVVTGVQREMTVEATAFGPAYERLRHMLTVRVMGRVEAVQEYHVSLDELFEAVRPEYMTRRAQFFDQERAMIVTVLEQGAAEGCFEFKNAQSVASTLLLATNAFLPYSLSVRELGTPATIRARLEAMLDLLLRGLARTTGG
jgi:AcrR family transcriptional regulator